MNVRRRVPRRHGLHAPADTVDVGRAGVSKRPKLPASKAEAKAAYLERCRQGKADYPSRHTCGHIVYWSSPIGGSYLCAFPCPWCQGWTRPMISLRQSGPKGDGLKAFDVLTPSTGGIEWIGYRRDLVPQTDAVTMNASSAPDSPAMTVFLPRLKFGTAAVNLTGEGGQSVSLNIQGLKYVGTAPGVPKTTVLIHDTEAVVDTGLRAVADPSVACSSGSPWPKRRALAQTALRPEEGRKGPLIFSISFRQDGVVRPVRHSGLRAQSVFCGRNRWLVLPRAWSAHRQPRRMSDLYAARQFGDRASLAHCERLPQTFDLVDHGDDDHRRRRPGLDPILAKRGQESVELFGSVHYPIPHLRTRRTALNRAVPTSRQPGAETTRTGSGGGPRSLMHSLGGSIHWHSPGHGKRGCFQHSSSSCISASPSSRRRRCVSRSRVVSASIMGEIDGCDRLRTWSAAWVPCCETRSSPKTVPRALAYAFVYTMALVQKTLVRQRFSAYIRA